jgi:hypothetical protein
VITKTGLSDGLNTPSVSVLSPSSHPGYTRVTSSPQTNNHHVAEFWRKNGRWLAAVTEAAAHHLLVKEGFHRHADAADLFMCPPSAAYKAVDRGEKRVYEALRAAESIECSVCGERKGSPCKPVGLLIAHDDRISDHRSAEAFSVAKKADDHAAWQESREQGAANRKLKEELRKAGEGFVYVMTNKAWPDWCKVGSALVPAKRVKVLNIGDPHRAYEIRAAFRCSDYLCTELACHALIERSYERNGEWFRCTAGQASELIESVLSRRKA